MTNRHILHRKPLRAGDHNIYSLSVSVVLSHFYVESVFVSCAFIWEYWRPYSVITNKCNILDLIWKHSANNQRICYKWKKDPDIKHISTFCSTLYLRFTNIYEIQALTELFVIEPQDISTLCESKIKGICKTFLFSFLRNFA